MLNGRYLISVVVPCYNESEALPYFYDEMTRVLSTMDVDGEMIFVDDGSNDATLDILQDLAKRDKRVRFVSFSRNFGKEAAMYAGLKAANGDFVCIMDADLQDPPALLPEMLDAVLNDGYDSVATKRSTREGEPPIRSFFANCFYGIINKMSKVKLVPGARDYRLMNRKMCDAVLSLAEYDRFTKGFFEWVGFKTKWLSYPNIQRVAGKTKWSFFKLFKYALESIVSLSTFPLTAASVIGGVISVLGLVGIIVCACLSYGVGIWSSAVICVGGMVMLSIGIMGMYVSRTYMQVKNRPVYIVSKTEKDI